MRRLVRLALGFVVAVVLASSAIVPPSAQAAETVQVVIRLRLPVSELSKVPVAQRGSYILCDGQMVASYVRDGVIDSVQRPRDSILGTTPRTLECLIRFQGVRWQNRVNTVYNIPSWGWSFFNVDRDGRVIRTSNRFVNVDTISITVPGRPLRARTFTYVIPIEIVGGQARVAN